jgi:glycosyltransferase involved in cell wall biosynthesis
MNGEILYIGPFNPERIVTQRRLPARNPAAYNRMLRLAKALRSVGANILVVSTGVSMRIGFARALIHESCAEEIDGISVTILPAVSIPVIGFLLEPLFLACWMFMRCIRNRPAGVMVYNATFATVAAVGIARLFGVRVVYEVEDVPSLKAISSGAGSERPRLLQHLSWMIASKVQRPLSHALIAPSRRFLTTLGISSGRAHVRVVSGCMDVQVTEPKCAELLRARRPLRVLFSGKLEAEHGFKLLLDTISLLLTRPECSGKFEFHICGTFNRDHSNRAAFNIPRHPAVFFHGFVSDDRYRELLECADVGLALQKSSGIYCNSRTPSKAYEFLASGKLLIATSVGDLTDLFPHAAIALDPETPEKLAAILSGVASRIEEHIRIAEGGLAIARSQFSLEAAGRVLASLLTSAA